MDYDDYSNLDQRRDHLLFWIIVISGLGLAALALGLAFCFFR